MARKVTHRTYAGWTMDELLNEFDSLGLSRRDYSDMLERFLNRTGRWCLVELLVRYHAP